MEISERLADVSSSVTRALRLGGDLRQGSALRGLRSSSAAVRSERLLYTAQAALRTSTVHNYGLHGNQGNRVDREPLSQDTEKRDPLQHVTLRLHASAAPLANLARTPNQSFSV